MRARSGQAVDIMYISNEVSGSLFHGFTLTNLMPPDSVKGNLIRNILYMIVELPVAAVPIINIRFFNFRAG
jgi:hypothetical protein